MSKQAIHTPAAPAALPEPPAAVVPPSIKPPPVPELTSPPPKVSAPRPVPPPVPARPASAEDDPELLEYVNSRRPDLVTATTQSISSGLETSVADLAGQSIDPLTPTVSEPQCVPAWIRFLEILNSPFASIPDSARIFLGKFALIVFLNAVAVLIYVLVFR